MAEWPQEACNSPIEPVDLTSGGLTIPANDCSPGASLLVEEQAPSSGPRAAANRPWQAAMPSSLRSPSRSTRPGRLLLLTAGYAIFLCKPSHGGG